MNFKERCSKECTRDAIFLFQRREVEMISEPYGWEFDGDVFIMTEEDATHANDDEIELFKKYQQYTQDGKFHDFSQPHRSVFDFWQYGAEDEIYESWHTESVWLTREEAEAHGKARNYNYKFGWRVYCVCAEGKLAQLIKDT